MSFRRRLVVDGHHEAEEIIGRNQRVEPRIGVAEEERPAEHRDHMSMDHHRIGPIHERSHVTETDRTLLDPDRPPGTEVRRHRPAGGHHDDGSRPDRFGQHTRRVDRPILLHSPSTNISSVRTHEAELPDRPQTIHALLTRWAGSDQDSALRLGHLTASEALQRVDDIAGGLRAKAGIERPVIAYETPPGIDGALMFLAATSVGTAAPLRPGQTPAEQAAALELIAPDLFVAASNDGLDALGAIGKAGGPADGHRPGGADLALVLTTSGTTGKPKRVGLNHGRLVTSASNIASWFELGPADHALTVMPLFHIHGLVAGILAPIAGGGSVSPVPFDAFAFGRHVADIQPTWCSAVPSMWELVLARWRDRGDELRSAPWRFLRTSSSALSATLMADLEDVFGVPVLEAYGMTEAAHQIAANPLPPAHRTPDSVGLATGDVCIRIADPDAKGEGHIQINGSTIIDGYLSGEAPESFDDGWFSTGDQGRLTDDGRLFITGRISEFINRGGDKISPREIEAALTSHPGVERAVAFPLPHPILGQVPAAAVVTKPGADVDVAAINEHIAELLSRPKRPTKLEIVTDWPLGPTGKLQRRFLAEQIGWA